MYPPEKFEQKLQSSWPGTLVQVTDLTGTKDHYQVLIVSPVFEGKSMVDQHRMVKKLFDSDIQSGQLHALSLKTYTPEEWAKKV